LAAVAAPKRGVGNPSFHPVVSAGQKVVVVVVAMVGVVGVVLV